MESEKVYSLSIFKNPISFDFYTTVWWHYTGYISSSNFFYTFCGGPKHYEGLKNSPAEPELILLCFQSLVVHFIL